MTTNIRVTAKKSLGQNFLVNEGVLARIIEVAQITPSDTIVEIGPGTGALTSRLAATGAHVMALEKDQRLIAPLKEQFANNPTVAIHEGDVLEWTPPYPAGSYKVVANIPYYLTSYLLRRMLEHWSSPSRAVLMVQYEVAQRMTARPPNMNLLALSVQLFARPSLILRVSPGSFRPMPDVDSAVVHLTIDRMSDEDRQRAIRILTIARPAFGQKRKQLKATIAASALTAAGISPTARPQELSVDDWIRLEQAVR